MRRFAFVLLLVSVGSCNPPQPPLPTPVFVVYDETALFKVKVKEFLDEARAAANYICVNPSPDEVRKNSKRVEDLYVRLPEPPKGFVFKNERPDFPYAKLLRSIVTGVDTVIVNLDGPIKPRNTEEWVQLTRVTLPEHAAVVKGWIAEVQAMVK
jgi:hypothetical protein